MANMEILENYLKDFGTLFEWNYCVIKYKRNDIEMVGYFEQKKFLELIEGNEIEVEDILGSNLNERSARILARYYK